MHCDEKELVYLNQYTILVALHSAAEWMGVILYEDEARLKDEKHNNNGQNLEIIRDVIWHIGNMLSSIFCTYFIRLFLKE